MKNIEEILNLKKLEIDNIEVPEELEGRLRNALHLVEVETNKPTQKLYWLLRHKVMAAVILFMILISGLNYDVFAFYGKKILGYDQVTSGSFKKLNELGKGQEINESYKFKNGTEVIVDGVMFDKNKLSIMYSIKGESKEKIQDLSMLSLRGIFKTYNKSNGRGIMSDDGKEIKWIHNFEPPSILDRNVTFTFRSNADDISKGEKGKIRFKINMDKAIKREVNSVINKTIEAQGVKYNFTTLSATQMSVLIDGTIQVNSEEGKELFGGPINGVRRYLKVELLETYIKNGNPITEIIQEMGSSKGSSNNEIKFQYVFDGLKPNIKSLTLNVLSTDDMRFIDKNININISTKNERVVQDSEELLIKEVKEEDGNTIVTFIGQEDVIFDTALFIGEVQVKELEMNSKIIDDKGRKVLEKTYKFEGTAKDMNLMFKTLSHRSNINKLILLYEEK
jgi:hypothetical protein